MKIFKKFYNTDDRFGMPGPFEATSKEALADSIHDLIKQWADERDVEISEIRKEFIAGLEEVDEEDFPIGHRY